MNDFVPLSSAGTRPFADFHVADVGAVDGEAQGAAHLVETVAAGSAGVEVKQVVNGVVDDLENVGVPRDEDFRAQRLDPRYGLRGVVAGGGGRGVPIVGGGNTYNLRDGVYCKGEALVKVSFAANGTVNIGVVDVNLASNDNAYPFNVEGYQYV